MPERRPVVFVTTGFEEYQAQLVAGVQTEVGANHPVLVVNAYNPTGTGLAAPVIELLGGLPCVGVIATACVSPAEEQDLLRVLRGSGIPAVRIATPTEGMSSVRGDDTEGVRAIMAHLLDDLGVRRPVLVRGLAHQPDSERREAVFREELAARGLTVDEDLVVDGHFWHETAYRRLRELLERRRDFDAVVAANDKSAVGAMKALTDGGVAIPDDVLVTGFDNEHDAVACWPGLTTADAALPEQGARAAAQLLAEAAGEASPAQLLLPTRLVVRGSTVPPPDPLTAAVAAAALAQERLTMAGSLRSLSYALSNTASPEAMAEVLAGSHLMRLGVGRCFVAVFTGDAADGGQQARLLLDYRGGTGHPVTPEPFPLTRLLPEPLRDELAAGALVFEPLQAGGRVFGYLLCEQVAGAWLVPDALRADISRTLYALLTRQDLQRHAESLERSVAERTTELRTRTHQLEREIAIRAEAEEQLQQLNDELHRLAMRDSLTDIPNRTALNRHLDEQWQLLARDGAELALLMIDVDLFKAYNDHYGHLAGDETLRVVARCLSRATRYPDDMACRYGGEEFVLVLPNSGVEGAQVVADRFREELAAAAIPHALSAIAETVTASVGICVARAGGDLGPLALLEAADRALYQAKTRGRDQSFAVYLQSGGGAAPEHVGGAALA